MEKVNVAFIGLGHRGLDLMQTLTAVKGANIVALCDFYQERLEEANKILKEKTGNTAKLYKDYKEVLKDKDICAVIVSTSWETHISISIDAMKAGKITAMEVGGAYNVQDCWNLVEAYEQTKTPFMLLENCCYDEFELLTTSLHRAGKLGEVVHCHGAYGHDLRNEIAGGNINKHYRLRNYLNRNCENYPTHELGPIAKLLDINRGNKMVSLVSVASKAVGMAEYVKSDKNKDDTIKDAKFMQGDIVNTIITCEDGSTISLRLDTTLPRYYSREFTVHATKGICTQEHRTVLLEEDCDMEKYYEPIKTVKEFINNADNYKEYAPKIWQEVTEEQIKLGHGGIDFFCLQAFIDCIINGEEMPIDIYDTASWYAITALSEISIKSGGAPQQIPDFTKGEWKNRPRKDVVKFPKIK